MVIAVAGTGVASAYLLENTSDAALDLTVGGKPASETVEFENILPGESRTVAYSVKNGGKAQFKVSFDGEETGLASWISVSVTVGGETVIADRTFSECVQTGAECAVDGDFEFTVVYTLNESAGNDMQGLACDIVATYALVA